MITSRDINNPNCGRFGNQLFKWALVNTYAIDNNVHACFPEWHFFEYINWIPNPIPENVEFEVWNDPQVYTPLPQYKHLDLTGYFQDVRYFQHRKNELVQTLEFKQQYKNMFQEILANDLPNWKDLKLAFIHVRRGDYKMFPDCHPILDKSYYDEAIKLIDYDKCFVFSDDIQWCRENLDYENLVFLNFTNMYFDFYVMTLCHAAIIANSTFGWWGAYLGNDKKVIAPKLWFGHSLSHVDTTNLIPKEWKRI
jgi:hypothetical protein